MRIFAKSRGFLKLFYFGIRVIPRKSASYIWLQQWSRSRVAVSHWPRNSAARIILPMVRARVDFDTARTISLSLPNVEKGTIHRSPALKLRGKLLACIPVHRSAEPDSIAVSIDFDARTELLDSFPKTYYLTDHYRNHPIVLVRLSRISHKELRTLLETAWQFVFRSRRKGI